MRSAPPTLESAAPQGGGLKLGRIGIEKKAFTVASDDLPALAADPAALPAPIRSLVVLPRRQRPPDRDHSKFGALGRQYFNRLAHKDQYHGSRGAKQMKRTADAKWQGDLKSGSGAISTASGVLASTPYSFHTRFENAQGTNPEELMAAAHAGCFSMKLSFVLGAAGFEPAAIETQCTITLENGAITNSHLNLKATVPGIGKEAFDKCVDEAAKTCPVSKSLNTNITHESVLNS